MNLNANNGNGNSASAASVEDTQSKLFPEAQPVFTGQPVASDTESRPQGSSAFATRSPTKAGEGVNKSKFLLLGGGLAVAVLFFVFTALMSKSSKKPSVPKAATQEAKQATSTAAKGSVTPVMDSVHPPAPDNAAGQLAPNDILRTRSQDQSKNNLALKPAPATPEAGSLGSVPSFAATQQRWEEPQPYGAVGAANPDGTGSLNPAQETQDHNALKEPSLVFVRNVTEGSSAVASKRATDDVDGPVLDIAPGTRIQAKLQSQISSAVQDPVVAQVEYTYAIGDKIVIPAGARIYGKLVQADRSGLVDVKFDEVELLDKTREKIDAVGLGLDLGPIKGDVYGKNTGKNFLIRAASGLGSVLAEIAGNNSSAAFSEDDMLRERLAENIGTAGDSEVMNLNANNRIIVSVPADTKIYVVFTKHQDSSTGLHRVASAAP
jgi:hypothetical protein